METECPRCQRMSFLVAARGQYAEEGDRLERIIRVCMFCKHQEIETRRVARGSKEALRGALSEVIAQSEDDQLVEFAQSMAKIDLEDQIQSQLPEYVAEDDTSTKEPPSDAAGAAVGVIPEPEVPARPTAAKPVERTCPKCHRESIAIVRRSWKEARVRGRPGEWVYVCLDCHIWWRSSWRNPDIPVVTMRGKRFSWGRRFGRKM